MPRLCPVSRAALRARRLALLCGGVPLRLRAEERRSRIGLPAPGHEPGDILHQAPHALRGGVHRGQRGLLYRGTRRDGNSRRPQRILPPTSMRYDWVTGFGLDQKGRRAGFNLTDNQVRDQVKYNENCLWLNNKIWPLPPVKVTRPQGSGGEWIVQDTRGPRRPRLRAGAGQRRAIQLRFHRKRLPRSLRLLPRRS